MEAGSHIVVFDGVCNLCNGLVRFIIGIDKKGLIRFTPLQSSTGRNIIQSGGTDPDSISTIVYLSDGKYYFRSAAILRIFYDIGRGWKLFYFLIVIPRFLRDFIYNMIARSRYRIFGKRDACMVPGVDVRDRFL